MAHIDSVILSGDVSHVPYSPVDRRMESVIVLRGESEDTHSAAVIALDLVLVVIAKKTRNCKLAPFDPETCSVADGFECHESAVGSTDDTVGVVRLLYRSGFWFEFAGKRFNNADKDGSGCDSPIEKLVERF